MTTELTPAVQDAAYRLGWRVAAVLGGNPDKTHIVLSDAFPFILDGFDAFTPEAEAERVEAVREAGKWLMDGEELECIARGKLRAEGQARYHASQAVKLDDTQGRIPDTP